MLVDELNQLHSNYINLSTNHWETSSFILKVVTSSWVSPSVSDSGLNNVRLNTVTDNPHFGCVRFSSFVVVEQPKRELLKLRPLLERGLGAAAHLHLKGHTQKLCVFAHTQIGANLTSYNKWSVGYFELKLHRHILGTPETYITSCKRGILSPL